MESRFQYILLSLLFIVGVAFMAEEASAKGKLDVNNENFEFYINTGVLSIQDFNSEFSLGIGATFNATEDFFLQYNYFQATASQTPYEILRQPYFSGGDRVFSHYDLLLGYNIFQGEVFLGKSNAQLSTLYVVLGVGDTSFGGENSFTSVWGLGYKVGITGKINVSVDFRDYAFKSTLNSVQQSTHNTHFTLGVGYLW